MDNRNVSQRIARSISWTIASKIASQALTMITMVVLARLLSVRDFGLMAMCVVYMRLLDNFIDAGFLQAIIQKKDIDSEALASCYWFLSLTVLTAYAITWFSAPLVSKYFSEPYVSKLLRIMSVVLFLAPTQILANAILSRQLRTDQIGKAELVGAVCRSATAISLALTGIGVWSLILGYIVGRTGIALMTAILAAWLPVFHFRFSKLRPIFSFGLKVTGSRLLWYFYSQADVIIVGRVLGTETLGLYSVALQLVNSALNFFSPVYNRVVFPVLVRFRDDIFGLARNFFKVLRICALISFPIMFGLSTASHDTIVILFGAKWEGASVLLAALACAGAFRIISPLGPLAVMAYGRPGVNIYINLITLLTMSSSLYFGAKLWGVGGVACAWVVVFPMMFLVNQKICTSILGIKLQDYFAHISKSVLLGILISIVALVIGRSGALDEVRVRYTVIVFGCLLIYVNFIYFFAKESLHDVIKIFNKYQEE